MTTANFSYAAVSAEDRVALTALCMEYVWRIDNGHAASIWTLFTPDGSCDLPWGVMVGEAALREAWEARAKRTVRTRHMISNLRFAPSGEGEITGEISLTLYVAEAGAPALATPAVVGEHCDTYRRNAQGEWRIHSRRFSPAFSSHAGIPVAGQASQMAKAD